MHHSALLRLRYVSETLYPRHDSFLYCPLQFFLHLLSLFMSDNKTGNCIVAQFCCICIFKYPHSFFSVKFSYPPGDLEGSGYDLDGSGSGSGDWSEQGNAGSNDDEMVMTHLTLYLCSCHSVYFRLSICCLTRWNEKHEGLLQQWRCHNTWSKPRRCNQGYFPCMYDLFSLVSLSWPYTVDGRVGNKLMQLFLLLSSGFCSPDPWQYGLACRTQQIRIYCCSKQQESLGERRNLCQ